MTPDFNLFSTKVEQMESIDYCTRYQLPSDGENEIMPNIPFDTGYLRINADFEIEVPTFTV